MRIIAIAALVLALMPAAFAREDVVSAVHGTIVKIDSGARIVVVKTADGTRHTVHIVDKTTVHGAEFSAHGATDSWHGLTEGTEVVAHYSKRGTEDTAVEIDRVADDGLKTAKGTVTEIDRGGKRLAVDTGEGSKKTFELTDHASQDAGKGIAKGAMKGSRVTVYYTEDAGKKVAHFFEAI